MYAAVYDHMLAYNHIVAYVAIGFIALPTEVLRVGADYGTLINFGILAKAGALHDRGVRHDFATIAYFNILVNESEWMDYDVLAELGCGIDVCKRAYHVISD